MNRHQSLLASFAMKPADGQGMAVLGRSERARAERAKKLRDRGMEFKAIAEMLWYLPDDASIAKLARKEELEAADSDSPQYAAMRKSLVLTKQKDAAVSWLRRVLGEAESDERAE